MRGSLSATIVLVASVASIIAQSATKTRDRVQNLWTLEMRENVVCLRAEGEHQEGRKLFHWVRSRWALLMQMLNNKPSNRRQKALILGCTIYRHISLVCSGDLGKEDRVFMSWYIYNWLNTLKDSRCSGWAWGVRSSLKYRTNEIRKFSVVLELQWDINAASNGGAVEEQCDKVGDRVRWPHKGFRKQMIRTVYQ